MHQRLRHATPHLVMLGVSLALYWAASQIDVSGSAGRIGPDFWPKLIVGVMILLCLVEAGKRLLIGPPPAQVTQAVAEQARPGTPPDSEAREPERWGMLGAGAALVVGYVAVVPWLGFFVSTVLFLSGFAWVGGFRRPLINLMLGVAGALLMVVLFMRVAYISLPLGEGVFRTVSTTLLALLGVK